MNEIAQENWEKFKKISPYDYSKKSILTNRTEVKK